MLTIVYDPMNGWAVPDNRVRTFVSEKIAEYKLGLTKYVHVGSSLLLDAFRLSVAIGEISHDDIIVEFNGKTYGIEKNGVTSVYGADDFPQEHVAIVSELIKRRCK